MFSVITAASFGLLLSTAVLANKFSGTQIVNVPAKPAQTLKIEIQGLPEFAAALNSTLAAQRKVEASNRLAAQVRAASVKIDQSRRLGEFNDSDTTTIDLDLVMDLNDLSTAGNIALWNQQDSADFAAAIA